MEDLKPQDRMRVSEGESVTGQLYHRKGILGDGIYRRMGCHKTGVPEDGVPQELRYRPAGSPDFTLFCFLFTPQETSAPQPPIQEGVAGTIPSASALSCCGGAAPVGTSSCAGGYPGLQGTSGWSPTGCGCSGVHSRVQSLGDAPTPSQVTEG